MNTSAIVDEVGNILPLIDETPLAELDILCRRISNWIRCVHLLSCVVSSYYCM